MTRPAASVMRAGLNSPHKRIRHVGAYAAAKMETRASRSSYGAGLEGHLTPQVFETPIDCQAIFLSPLAVRRVRRSIRRALVPHAACQRRRDFAAAGRSKSAALMQASRPPISGACLLAAFHS
jgi:hypothetical protein